MIQIRLVRANVRNTAPRRPDRPYREFVKRDRHVVYIDGVPVHGYATQQEAQAFVDGIEAVAARKARS